MFIRLELKKSLLSTWMTVSFSIILFLTGFYSDFFQAPIKSKARLDRYSSLFQPGQILGVRQLILKNNLGTFHFEKTATDPDTQWKMISPRKIPANSSLVKNILQKLNDVKIKSVHTHDPINIANYALDTSTLEITLIDSNEKSSTLKFGLINSLDNSTYVSLKEQNSIYHINNVSKKFNSYDLSDFVDSRIFTFDLTSINSFTIFRGKSSKKQVSFQAKKKNGAWYGKLDLPLKTETILSFFGELSDLRSSFIIDKVSENLHSEIEKYLDNIKFEIEVVHGDNKIYRYKISSLIRSLPGLNLNKRENFIIKPSNRNFPYILNKKFFNLFNQNDRKFRK